MAVGKGRDGGHLSNQAVGLLLARLGVKNFLGVVIESGERGDGGDHHAHGVGVVVEAVEKFLDALVNEGVVRDVVGPLFELRGGGEIAVEEQVGGVGVGAFFGGVFDGIAAIAEDAGVAVNEGDAADAGSSVVVSGVVTHHAEFGGVDFDLAQ